MSEITILWNQLERTQDLSEVWTPSEENGLKFLQENRETGRYPKHVIIENHIGYMIMPGIYCFGKYSNKGNSDFQPAEILVEDGQDIFQCARKSAVLGYYFGVHIFPPDGFALLYLAIDEENIEILKKMQRYLDGYELFENAVLETTETQRETEEPAFPEIVLNPPKEDSGQTLIESTAEELMPGLGIRDIRVGLKCIFSARLPVAKYKYVYKSVEKLILIPYSIDRADRQEYDLCILEELTVRKTEALRCGILIDRDYFLIDCREQKEKQMLTPEAYELLRKNKLLELE